MSSLPSEERACDKEVVDFFLFHIRNPCSVPGVGNIRGFYIRENRKLLDDDRVTDPLQRQRLEDELAIMIPIHEAEWRKKS